MTSERVLSLRVAEVIEETPDAHSIVFHPPPGTSAGSYRPGQFLTLDIPTDREGGAARCYSLSSSPHVDEPWKVTVKRTVDGYGSNWVCDNLVAGSTIDVLVPSGTFTPRSLDADFLLFAAGSGITPVMSILKSVLYGGSGRVMLVYANRDERSVIFRDALVALEKEHPDRLQVLHFLESVQGLPRSETLTSLATAHADRQVFICGPTPFMDVVSEAAATAGVPHDRIHHERFLSLDNDPFTDGAVELDDSGPTSTVEVLLDGTSSTLSWPRSNKLLDVLLDAGLDAPYSCREGNCSACACVLLEGDAEMERNEVLEDEDIADGIVLGCQLRPLSDRLRISYDV